MKQAAFRSNARMALSLATLVFATGVASAAEQHEHMHAGHDHAMHASPPPSSSLAPENVAVTLSSKYLSDQDGHRLLLKDDVIGDRVVVLSFVYTNCTTVCPAVSAVLSDLQNKLGSRLDSDVRLVSLTVDPVRDTPSRLKSFSEQVGAKKGWLWLTGSSASVTEALKGFGAYTAKFEDHPVIIMIGDGRSGKWSRHYALSKPERLLSQVDEYLANRNNGMDASHHQHTAQK